MKNSAIWIFVACLLGGLANTGLAEEPSFVAKAFPESYDRDWTPEELLNARPRPLAAVPHELLDFHAYEQPQLAQSLVREVEGSPPTLDVEPDPHNFLFDPRDLEWRMPFEEEEETGLAPKSRGTKKLDFTSSQLIPLSADRYYPYTTVGKLFFRAPDGDFFCSAATIGPRIVLTSGMCVHDGRTRGSGGYFSDFVFVPAYRDGLAPFGQWRASWVMTTPGWANSGGVVPARDDFGILVMRDQGGDRIGDVVGWLGWCTNKLKPNHVTMLGFSANFDDAEKMHQVQAGRHSNGGKNTVVYGSDMRSGSGGGPWVQDFGVEANRVVGVCSYMANALDPKYQGGSNLSPAFVNIWDRACNQNRYNCSAQ